MADTVTGLLFEIGADPSQALTAISGFEAEASQKLAQFENKLIEMTRESLGISKEFAEGMAISAGAVASVTAAMFGLADKAAHVGAAIFEASEKTGLAAENLSGLDAISKLTGENFDSLTETLARAGRNLELSINRPGLESSKILAQLMGGAQNLAQLGLLPMDERLQVVLQRIFALNDVGQRNLDLTALLGRGWQSNVETLKLLAEEGYAPAIEKAKELGVYYDEAAAARAKAFLVEWAEAKNIFASVALEIGGELVPAFSSLLQSSNILFETWMRAGTWAYLKDTLSDASHQAVDWGANILGLIPGLHGVSEAADGWSNAARQNTDWGRALNEVAKDQIDLVARLTTSHNDLAATLDGDAPPADAAAKGIKSVGDAAEVAEPKLKKLLDTAKSMRESGDLATAASALNQPVSPVPSAIGGGGDLDSIAAKNAQQFDLGARASQELQKYSTSVDSSTSKISKDLAAQEKNYQQWANVAEGAMEKVMFALGRSVEAHGRASKSMKALEEEALAASLKTLAEKAGFKAAEQWAEALSLWPNGAGMAAHFEAAAAWTVLAAGASFGAGALSAAGGAGGGGGGSLTKDSVQSSYGSRGGDGGGYEGGQGGSENPQTTFGTGGGDAARAPGSQPLIPSQQPVHIMVMGDSEQARWAAEAIQNAVAMGHFVPSSHTARPAPAVRSG